MSRFLGNTRLFGIPLIVIAPLALIATSAAVVALDAIGLRTLAIVVVTIAALAVADSLSARS